MKTRKRGPDDHVLTLYVAGITPRSMRAVQNIKRICDTELAGHYELEVVDVYRHPRRAVDDQIVAIPTLIKEAPGTSRRLIGDLSEERRVRQGLGLTTT
jgi:circadian clock protein KaiB